MVVLVRCSILSFQRAGLDETVAEKNTPLKQETMHVTKKFELSIEHWVMIFLKLFCAIVLYLIKNKQVRRDSL